MECETFTNFVISQGIVFLNLARFKYFSTYIKKLNVEIQLFKTNTTSF